MNRDEAYRQFQYERYEAEKAGVAEAPAAPEVAPVMPQAEEPEEMSLGDQATGFAGSMAQGATANFIDEALAAPMAGFAHLIGDAPKGEKVMDTYSKMKGAIRDRQKTYSAENPKMDMLGKMAGGMVGLGKVGQGINTVKGAAGMGAGYGAAEYAGGLDDWSDAEMGDAAVATGLSGVMGGGAQKARQWFASNPDAMAKVLKKLQENVKMSPDDLRARGAAMGPEASLADVTGDTGVAFAQGARSRGGLPAIDAVEKNLGKVSDATKRVKDTMSTVSGKKDGQYFESLDALKGNRKQRAELKYGAALDNQYLKPDPEIERLLNDVPIVKGAWDKVISKEMNKGNKNLPPKGDRSVMPSMRSMQKVKWELDKMISNRAKSTDSAGKDQMGDLIEAKNLLMGRIDKQNPAFKAANKAYAGDSAMIDAQELGMKNGLGSAKVEEQLQAIKQMTMPEKEAYLQGAMSNAYGKLGASPEHMMGNINQMSSENSRKVLNKLVGKDKAGKLMDQFKTERRYREVDTKVRQGSQTQLREAADSAMGRMEGDIPIDEVTNLKGVKILKSGLMKMLPKLPAGDAADLAGMLTKPGGIDAAMKRMEMIGVDRTAAQDMIDNLMRSSASVAPTVME